MLSYIELKNFKALTDVKLDLRGKNGKPKKAAFIYGENGAGKTNLISSIFFLEKSLLTLTNHFEKLELLDGKDLSELVSGIEHAGLKEALLQELLKEQFFSIEMLIKENRTFNCNQDMRIKIGFYLNGAEGSYELIFDDSRVIFEELKYLVKERVGTLYSISEKGVKLSPSCIPDSSYRKELQEYINKYWGKHTFMSILFNEKRGKNLSYLSESVNPNLMNFSSWLGNLSLLCKHAKNSTGKMFTPIKLLPNLEKGITTSKEDKELLSMERFLNSVFTGLYSDIKKVYYNFTPSEGKYIYELNFAKLIDGEIKEIPFALESTGTQQLLEVVKFIFLSMMGNTVLVDEMENGIHDLLVYELISSLLESFEELECSEEHENMQFIATTHNTYLMEVLPKEMIYIFSSDDQGKKSIIAIDDFEHRTQKNHNIRLKYLRGDYTGIPYVGYLNFKDLLDDLKDGVS